MFGGAKSQNEFAAPELGGNWFRVVVVGNFGKSKFSWKVDSPGRFRALNRSGELAGATSMLCGVSASYWHMTCRAVWPKSNTIIVVITQVRANIGLQWHQRVQIGIFRGLQIRCGPIAFCILFSRRWRSF